MKPGGLFYLIDDWGRNQGVAVFLDSWPPGTLTTDITDKTGLWHYEILHGGTKKFVQTGNNSLIPLVNEEEP